jgi:hypothetical protein
VRFALLLTLAVVAIGFVLVMTMGSLLGLALIIGGLGGLGWVAVPDLLDRFTAFLSTGSFRRRDWGD